MESQLLATKLQIPPRSHQLVQRTRLLDRLDSAVLTYNAISISAPAGYGKTSLLAQWAQSCDIPVAWLALGKDDSDTQRFLRYLFRAWETVQPEIGNSSLDVLLGSVGADREAVLSAFVNVANDVPGPTALVLDDFHLIDDPEIHESIAFLIDYLPANLHLVIAARGDPPLPLARYRARNQLHEIRADDLSFTVEETAEFARERIGIQLTGDQVRELQRQTEGWVAGLQLAALTFRSAGVVGDIDVTGQQRYIADYFGEDVLARQPEHVQRFLLYTSVLDEVSGALSNAVTGGSDGQELLEMLERENLFLIPLDDRRSWFRYHRLFAEFLRQELERRHADEAAEVHRRAAEWYLANDLSEQAFEHALAGDDADLVIRIIDRDFYAKLLGGEMTVVQRWIESIPPAWFDDYPPLSVAQAGRMLTTGAFDATLQRLDDIERHVSQTGGHDASEHLAKLDALRCFIACFTNDLDRAERFAERAMDGLPETDTNLRPGIFGALGDTYRRNGRWGEAQRSYLQMLDFSHTRVFRVLSAHLYGALADLELQQGHLRAAEDYWSKARAVIEERENWGRFPLPAIGWVYIRTGELHYERDDLSHAREYLAPGLERAEISGDVRAQFAGYLIAGRIELTDGDIEAAAEYLDRARQLAGEAPSLEWHSRFERLQLELWLAQGRLRAAVNWTDEALEDDGLHGRPNSEPAQLALARVLIVKGDPSSREQAIDLIDRLHRTVESEGRTGVQIEALALRSIAQQANGDRVEALTSIERALRLAEPEGYVRLFADLGPPIARILQEARSRNVLPDYVDRLLAACGAGLESSDRGGVAAMPEPLTTREQEILEMIAAGLTNSEIGTRLFISPETVKKHAGNIYGKLGVHTRTEASARARELELLD